MKYSITFKLYRKLSLILAASIIQFEAQAQTPTPVPAIPCSIAAPYVYNDTTPPCYPDTRLAASPLAFPQLWDNNLQSQADPSNPGKFVKFMLEQLQAEPYSFMINLPSSATSYIFFRPEFHRASNVDCPPPHPNPSGCDDTTKQPFAVIGLKLANGANATTLGTASVYGESLQGNVNFTPTFLQCPSVDQRYRGTPAAMESLKRCYARLNLFYKYAKYFSSACTSTPAPQRCFVSYQLPNWVENYLLTFRTVGKVKRTLAWLIYNASFGTSEVLDFVDKPVAPAKWDYSKLAATTTIGNRRLSKLEWIGAIPWISDEALERDPISGVPKWLFVQRQSSPLDGGTITYSKSLFPDMDPVVENYTFTTMSNGDQLLSNVATYGGYTANTTFYGPDPSDPSCAKSSANSGAFALEANRCRPRTQWVYNRFDDNYPKWETRQYTRGYPVMQTTIEPLQPWSVWTSQLICPGPDPTVAGLCPEVFHQVEQFAYQSSDRNSYYQSCKATFAGGGLFANMINVATDTLPVHRHGLRTGDKISLEIPWANDAPAGLVRYGTYYAIVIDENNIKLASSVANATNGVAVDITSTAKISSCSSYWSCSTIFVSAHDLIGNTKNRLVKRVEFYSPGGSITEAYDYIHEADAPAKRCWSGTPTATPG